MRRVLILMAVFVLGALAADISGNWKATAEGPNGAMERTFVFKVDGNKVTGETTSSMLGKSTITDGKIEGDTVTFSITAKFGDNDMKINYKGKVVNANEIRFTSETSAGGQGIEWVAKKTT